MKIRVVFVSGLIPSSAFIKRKKIRVVSIPDSYFLPFVRQEIRGGSRFLISFLILFFIKSDQSNLVGVFAIMQSENLTKIEGFCFKFIFCCKRNCVTHCADGSSRWQCQASPWVGTGHCRCAAAARTNANLIE